MAMGKWRDSLREMKRATLKRHRNSAVTNQAPNGLAADATKRPQKQPWYRRAYRLRKSEAIGVVSSYIARW